MDSTSGPSAPPTAISNWTSQPASTESAACDLPPPVPEGMQALMYIMYIAVSVAAIGGNGIVCYIVLAYQRMRTVTNMFIMNLAIGDILMASLCIPFTFVSNLLLGYWPFGGVMCVVVTYAQCVTVFISAYTLIAISVDRYTAIVYPLRPRMTKLRSKIIIGVVWLVALVTPLPTALVTQLVPHPCANQTYYCLEQWGTPEQTTYYSMALMILQYFFPLLALIFTYTRIAVVVWGKETPGEAQDERDQRMAASKRKMIKMMIACVAAFLLCWLPLNLFIVVSEQYPDVYDLSGIGYVWFVCHWLAMSHTCYNPLIYFWMNAKFRTGLQAVFRCWHVPKKKSSCFVSTVKKMIKMMIMVVTVFMLCWFPLNAYILLSDLNPDINSYEYIRYIYFVIHWLAMSHASYNPFIYCWMNAKFREGFGNLTRRCWPPVCWPGRLRRRTLRKESNEGAALRRVNTYTTYVSVRAAGGGSSLKFNGNRGLKEVNGKIADYEDSRV